MATTSEYTNHLLSLSSSYITSITPSLIVAARSAFKIGRGDPHSTANKGDNLEATCHFWIELEYGTKKRLREREKGKRREKNHFRLKKIEVRKNKEVLQELRTSAVSSTSHLIRHLTLPPMPSQDFSTITWVLSLTVTGAQTPILSSGYIPVSHLPFIEFYPLKLRQINPFWSSLLPVKIKDVSFGADDAEKEKERLEELGRLIILDIEMSETRDVVEKIRRGVRNKMMERKMAKVMGIEGEVVLK